MQTVVATAYSAGNFDVEQINEAYGYFGFKPRDNGVTDELILGTFQSRLQDSAKHEADMRAHLKTIGQHRHSQQIKDVAEEGELLSGDLSEPFTHTWIVLNTYEQALAFFDTDVTVADDFVPTLYTSKVRTVLESQCPVSIFIPHISFKKFWTGCS